ncbi:methyltransferase family protein [Aestuariibacter salexigens]|uniref:methyltransferase family protein n=1 Tax=Aestuariibacter salexigens TaxID=226010 RepID=UPI000403D181|nr:isoprenylcysteine carboxylmethyltransferase family protein [Aestuariibacter salexigens]
MNLSALELKVYPLLLLAIFAVASVMTAFLPTMTPLNMMLATWVLISAGFAIAVWGVVEFRRASTTVDPTKVGKVSKLVTSGPFRFTRNPMYVGMTLCLLGIQLGWGAWPSLLLAPLFIAYITRFQIIPEERAITDIFGVSFIQYCQRVRRWL